jgi:hypothetical protein
MGLLENDATAKTSRAKRSGKPADRQTALDANDRAMSANERRKRAMGAGAKKASEGAAPIEHGETGTAKLGGANPQARSGSGHLSKPKGLASRRQHRGGK